jgi:hypothetical protein
MLILLVVRSRILPLVERAAAVDIDHLQAPEENSARALQSLNHQRYFRIAGVRVRPRQLGVVVERDGHPFFRHDEAGVDVAAGELTASVDVVRAEVLGRVMAQAARFAAHRGQISEAVATVDARPPRNRSDRMRRIQVCIPAQSVHPRHEAGRLAKGRGGCHGRSRLAVNQLTQHSLRHQVEPSGHPAKAVVLQHHAGHASLLGCVHELPALFNVMAAGTSVAAYLPAFMAATAIGVWSSQGVSNDGVQISRTTRRR